MMHDTIWVTQKPLMRNQVKPNSFCFAFAILARRRNGKEFSSASQTQAVCPPVCLPACPVGRLSVSLYSPRWFPGGVWRCHCCPWWWEWRSARRTPSWGSWWTRMSAAPPANINHTVAITSSANITHNVNIGQSSTSDTSSISSIAQRDSGNSVYCQSHRETVRAPYIVNRTERQWELRISSVAQTDSGSSVYRQSHRETVRAPYIVNRTERQWELRNLTRTNPDLLLGKLCRTT